MPGACGGALQDDCGQPEPVRHPAYEVVWKPTLITNELIPRTFNEANADEECAGVITWMHTFSPAKSWILGLQEFRKPLMHFHTQFQPGDSI